MKQRITDIIKTFGENDGICSRIYVDGFKHDGWDILSVAWSYEDENLLVFLQDENDRYTNTEWFDSLPYLTQIQICADIENRFGIKFDTITKENVFDDMRNILKDRDDKMINKLKENKLILIIFFLLFKLDLNFLLFDKT